MMESLKDLAAHIEAIKQTGDLSRFVGMEETEFFDAKYSPGYDLEMPNGRFEVAKDVSSFANTDGGYIVIGLATTPLSTKKTEVVSALDLLDKEDVSIAKYEGVLREYIYPSITGLRLEWLVSTADTTKGVVAITVPKQDESRKYFLIKKLLEGDARIRGVVFGIAQRTGAASTPLKIEEVYKMVLKGKHPTAKRLTRIEEKIDLLLSGTSTLSRGLAADQLTSRIRELEDEALRGL